MIQKQRSSHSANTEDDIRTHQLTLAKRTPKNSLHN